MDWREQTYVAVDFEATTADARRAEPLSMGWVRVREGRVRCGEAGYTLLRPSGEVPVSSIRVHGLLPEHLAHGADPQEAGRALAAALGEDGVLVAHGASLERAVLARMGVRVGAVVDTLAVVRRLDQRAGRHRADARLPAAARRWGVPPLPAHHAFRDAMSSALLLLAVAGEIEQQRGACTAKDLALLGR